MAAYPPSAPAILFFRFLVPRNDKNKMSSAQVGLLQFNALEKFLSFRTERREVKNLNSYINLELFLLCILCSKFI